MSKTAKNIAEHLNSSIGFEELLDILVDIDTAEGRDAFAELIDQALEGKIISKSEVDALRKDAENMQSAQDAYNYTESLNSALRREIYLKDCAYQSVVAELNGAKSENLKLKQENVNLKLDNYALKQFPQVYYATDWGFEKSWTGSTIPSIPKNEVAAVKVESIPWWKFWTPNW